MPFEILYAYRRGGIAKGTLQIEKFKMQILKEESFFFIIPVEAKLQKQGQREAC